MRRFARGALVAAALAAGCGSSSGPSAVSGNDAAAASDEAGNPGRRGGGGGAFGGGDDDAGLAFDLASASDPIFLPGDDAPSTPGIDAPAAVDSSRQDTAAPPDAPPRDVASVPDAPTADTTPASPCDQCTALEMKYADALARARVCNPMIKAQCQMKASMSLSCPCANVWVNNTSEIEAIAKMYQDASCGKCTRFCPLACRILTAGVCNPSKVALPVPAPGAGMDPAIGPITDRGTCADVNDGP